MTDKEKLEKILLRKNVEDSIRNNIIFMYKVIPELKFLVGFKHKNPEYHLDVFEHTMLAVSLSKRDFEVRLTLILHDIGKRFSYQEVNGVRYYKNHQKVSYQISKKILNRMKYDEITTERILYLIKNYDTLITDEDIESTDRNLFKKRLYVQYADVMAHKPDKVKKEQIC